MTKEKYNLRNHSQNLFNKNNQSKNNDKLLLQSSRINSIVGTNNSTSIRSSSFKYMIRSYVTPVSNILNYKKTSSKSIKICCNSNKEIICNFCLSKKLENNINQKTNENIDIKDRLNTFFTMVAVREEIIEKSFSSK